MDAFAALRTLLAVRSYQAKPVPDAVVRRILEAGRLTGSAMNRQPWHFIVVKNPETLKSLGALASSGPYIAQAPLAIVVAIARRRELRPFFVKHGRRAMFGGLIGVIAYGLVIWAMSGRQLAYVAALRETSVVIAAGIGAFVLGEKFGMRRILAAAVVASGIVVLAVARR